MTGKLATTYDYQARGREFSVNDLVHPVGAGAMDIGRVSAVWPGIGMVQVEFSYGSRQYPVEDVERLNPENTDVMPTMTENVPGGSEDKPTVSAGRPPVPTGKGGLETGTGKDTTEPGQTVGPTNAPAASRTAMDADSLARAFVKKSLYWHSADRNYRATKTEFDGKHYLCPKCPGPDKPKLRKAIYKMREGERSRVYVCPNCTFIVKQDNIHTDHHLPSKPPAHGEVLSLRRRAADDRAKQVKEIVARFPRDSKKGSGEETSLFLTGDVAKVLGKKDYTAIKVSDLSDDQLDKLHARVTKRASEIAQGA